MASSQQRCVFVGNIPYDATEEQLVQICEEVGPVVSFRLVIDRETGKPKGYGFCEYKDEETALSARRNLQGYDINGRQLRVDFAENDKNADRNRELGRGGPGMTSNIDAQKTLSGPASLADSFQQPIGLPLAATAASVMAGALGGVQTGSVGQNGLHITSGIDNDPLTHYLAKMSRAQLYEIMSGIKLMANQNNALARQLLLVTPQLSKALFQAQIMLGMLTPQLLQMPNIRPSSGGMQPSLSQEERQDRLTAPSFQHGQTPLQGKMQIGQLPRLADMPANIQNASIPQSLGPQPQSIPGQPLVNQNVPGQPLFHYPQQGPVQVRPQSSLSAQPGVPMLSSIRPSVLSVNAQAPSVTSDALKPQMPASVVQQPRPVASANLGFSQLPFSNGNLHHSAGAHLPQYNATVQPGSSTLSVCHDLSWSSRNNAQTSMPSGLTESALMMKDTSELANASKMARLSNESSNSLQAMARTISSGASTLTQVSGSGTTPVGDTPAVDNIVANNVLPEKKLLQLPPEVESALLQQVMNLTSEQLSSLPPEQRQQVLQLQQMLQ